MLQMSKTLIAGTHLLIWRALFSLQQLCCHIKGTHTFLVLPQVYISPLALKHSLAGRETDHFTVHRPAGSSIIGSIMLIGFGKQEEADALDTLKRENIKSVKIEKLTCVWIFWESGALRCVRTWPERQRTVAASCTTCWHKTASWFWRQVPHGLSSFATFTRWPKRLSTVGRSPGQGSTCGWFWLKYKQSFLTLMNQPFL